MTSKLYSDIYEIVKQIPRSRVCTYGIIAKLVGINNGARVVGWAMSKSALYKDKIPAHRVVNSKGILTASHKFDKGMTMQELLEEEGIKIENNQILNINEYIWDPFQID
ncbi:MAG: MGMT family protein [Marinifilaceae bacterium]|jgi:methylated-DNA-protein-cysteine methyltransferase-like protein|nr:MGMT family protein [Marinifilaceae bacterium]